MPRMRWRRFTNCRTGPLAPPAQSTSAPGESALVTWADDAEKFPVGPRWVVHLPMNIRSLPDAMLLAVEITNWLDELAVDGMSVEISREDNQSKRYRVFCGRRVHGLRCARRRGHGGKCRPRAPQPAPEPDESELAE
jgi:hypothetical protein